MAGNGLSSRAGEEPMQGVNYDIELITGCQFLYDGGCFISTYLVLNHEEYAGRTVDFGYCPVLWGGTFIGDYMDLLNAAVEKVSAGLTETPENRPATPWWKFW